jgi:serine/threonine-protein kinase
MPELTKEKFIEYVRRSRLVADGDLKDFLKSLRKITPRPKTAEQLADKLVEAKHLNRWHADNILRGKYKGFTLGKYRLLGHLGTGGMSSVFLAEHPVMKRFVAIKVLPKKFVEDPNYLDRFKREARAVAALDHPNIVRAYDIDQDRDRHYIVMEHVDGRDLQRIVKEDGPVKETDAADFIAQAATGLQHAHDAGLIHRDVKPANCLLDRNGLVKLLDLGLAKFSEDERSLSAIYEDTVVGTADYLAPEQAINSQNIDSRADIYGLGCTLYFMLVGKPPFPDGSIAERLLKHQTKEPASILDTRPATSPTLVDICRRMMIKEPADRIQTAAEAAAELNAWLETRKKRQQLPAGGSDIGSGIGSSVGGLGGSRVPPPLPAAGTVSSSAGSTFKVGLNDNLALAPIDEEVLSGDSSKETGGASPRHDSDSSSIDSIDIGDFESGPLDALLSDGSFKSGTELPKARFQSKRDGIPTMWIIIGLVIALLLAVVAALVTFS